MNTIQHIRGLCASSQRKPVPGKRLSWKRMSLLALLGGLLLCIAVPALTRTAAAAPVQSEHTDKHTCRPCGKVWKLVVTAADGNRQGQHWPAMMTFNPNGSMTATFPGASPDDPPAQPSAFDGQWWMTGASTFHYRFRDPIYTDGLTGQMVAYVQVEQDAYLTSSTTFVSGGVGVAYAVSTGLPIAGQYGVTSTTAVAV